MKRFAHVCNLPFFALFCLLAPCLFGQSDFGAINGVVRDPSGAGVPGAQVTLRNQGNGTEKKFSSSADGQYSATNIPAGLYTVIVDAKGFKRFESTNNKLDPASTLEVDTPLSVGNATETVEVVASTAQLQTETASVQKLVTREQIDALELNGRNPVGLANLTPGAHTGNMAGLNINFNQGPSNFNGSRNPENLITYDGAPATRTRSNGTSLGAADVDSTSEVQILTAAYAAEYGRTSGAQIRIVTRSGGTDFHGAAYEYVRNDAFNANTWTRNHTFTNGVPQNFVGPFRYNQYGFNVGGPFYIPGKFNSDKTKFFWYWGSEWVKYRYTDSATWTVPSALMRQGNFSELLSATNPGNFLGKQYIIKDPSGNPYPNNVIPATALSPNGLGILKAYPVANLSPGNFIGGTSNYYITALHPVDQRKDTLAADINFTEKQRLQFRRNNFQYTEYQPLDGTPTETPKYFIRPNQTNSLDYVWTISPNIVNEALATVSIDNVYIPVDSAHFFDRTTAGINFPYIFPNGKLIQNRIPTANITGLSGLTGNPYPSHSAGPIYTLSDSLTWIKGTHTMKFGMYYERSGENDNDEINVSACPTCTNNQNGQFLFTDSGPGGTGSAIANTAIGKFDTYSELGQRAYTIFRGSSFEPYAQDSWKVSDKLTVNIGVRYTVIVPYKALWANMIVFDPTLYDPSKAVTVNSTTGLITVGNGDRYNGMVIPGSGWPSSASGRFPEATNSAYNYLFRGGKYPDYYSNIQWGQIQPRLGIAYQMTPKTVIRAGGGRFFTRLGVSDSIFLGGNPPFQPTANVTAGSADNPGGTSTNVQPLTVTTQSRNFKNPEAWNWNFTLEREFWNSLITVGYVGRRGLHLQRESDINQPLPSVVAAARAINPKVNIDSLRPYLGYNSIRETDNVATSLYHGFQLTFSHRLNSGLLFGATYTLSKSWDNGSNQRDIIPNTYYADNLWGPSEFDSRHSFVANFMYELPFFKHSHGFSKSVLGGWQVSGVVQAQTGTPCSVVKNTSYAGVGVDGSLGCSGAGEFWVQNGTISYQKNFDPSGGLAGQTWFTVSSPFTAPTAGTFNNAAGIRDNIYNPGFSNVNFGLFKRFAFTERIGVQFRAEAFNAFNHDNWSNVNLDPTNATTFGKVTGKQNNANQDARNLQLSLRFYF